MFDLRLLVRTVAVIVALVSAAGGIAEALSAISSGATVDEWAVRGERTSPEYGLPVSDGDRAGWGNTHAAYPATDVFVGCGAGLVSPVRGQVIEVRRVNSYDPTVDNPATRGGRSVAILGDDGVRYYLAHFDTIVDELEPGTPVNRGDPLGTMGDTGRTSACHLHFSISPPCPGKEWSVRRGAIWPHRYLDAWRRGEHLSPADEVETWAATNPTACADAMADPFAPDA